MEKMIITNNITGASYAYESMNVLSDLPSKATGNEFAWGYPNNYSYEVIDITAEYNKRKKNLELEAKERLCKEVLREIKLQFDNYSFEDKLTLKSRQDISTIINALAVDGSLDDSYTYALTIPTDELLTQELKDAILGFWANKITEFNNLGL